MLSALSTVQAMDVLDHSGHGNIHMLLLKDTLQFFSFYTSGSQGFKYQGPHFKRPSVTVIFNVFPFMAQ